LRLKHIDLQVSDVDAAREFFETFFGLRVRHQRQKQIAFFEDETGFEFNVSNLFDSPPPVYPPDFHVGSSSSGPATYTRSTTVSGRPASP
jgi:catechol 2,3-dioxygenase-like lactoylglutathione lyase family enzyme